MARDKRLFARFDLDYPDHPKIGGLSDSAFRVHVEMILYSRKYMTDGRIAKRIAKRWPESALSELLANDDERPSLIVSENGDYLLHDYSNMQETRDEIEKKQQVNAVNGRRGGLSKGKRTAKQTASESLSENLAETETETESDTSSEKSDDPRIDELCNDLASRMVANGCKKPNITKAWRTAARLILTKDGRSFSEAKSVLAWSQDDSFWMTNIQSMPKFRDQYDQLRLKSTQGNVTPLVKADVGEHWSSREAWGF